LHQIKDMSNESTPTLPPHFSASSSLKRSRILFQNSSDSFPTSLLPPLHDPKIHKAALRRKIQQRGLTFDPNEPLEGSKKGSMTMKILHELRSDAFHLQGIAEASNKKNKPKKSSSEIVAVQPKDGTQNSSSASLKGLRGTRTSDAKGTLIVHRESSNDSTPNSNNSNQHILALPSTKKRILTKSSSSTKIPTPKWHAPWRLSSVLSSHLGWVRSVAFDPTNDMFATGAADRVIKIFDLAKASVGREDALKITLTGHIGPIRGMAFSERHPYLFSAGEDKQVKVGCNFLPHSFQHLCLTSNICVLDSIHKCWDLETNQVVRHYHGHLSGVFCLKLHPTLDLLVTGGRDAVARVWDMRTKHQIHCLSGHDNTVGSILTKSVNPQIITSSYDSTIKLWDIVAGKSMATLTHHKKSVRALCQPSFESTFLSASADSIKKWQHKDGRFLRSFTGHNSVVNALAVNDDGVVLSAGDDGSMKFWDYHSGYCFQDTETIAQPGSLEAENGIYAAEFDGTGTRLITCEADKTIKIWKEDENESEESYAIDMAGWRKKCLKEAKQRF